MPLPVSWRELFYYCYPIVYVRFNSVLYVAEFFVEFTKDRTRLPVLGEGVAFAVFFVVDVSDGADDGSGSACSSFVESGEFFNGNLAYFHLHAHVECQLLQTLIGDGWQDGIAFGCNIFISLYGDEVGRSALFDVFFLARVKIEFATVSFARSLYVCAQRSSIVASNFVLSGSLRCGTVIFACDDVICCRESAFEVWSYGSDENDD